VPAFVFFSEAPAHENSIANKVFGMPDNEMVHPSRLGDQPMRKRNVRAATTRILR
jgi:hypothetical protein